MQHYTTVSVRWNSCRFCRRCFQAEFSRQYLSREMQQYAMGFGHYCPFFPDRSVTLVTPSAYFRSLHKLRSAILSILLYPLAPGLGFCLPEYLAKAVLQSPKSALRSIWRVELYLATMETSLESHQQQPCWTPPSKFGYLCNFDPIGSRIWPFQSDFGVLEKCDNLDPLWECPSPSW